MRPGCGLDPPGSIPLILGAIAKSLLPLLSHAYHSTMETRRWQRSLAAGLALAALPVIAVAAAPRSSADDCDFDPGSFDCFVKSDDNPMSGWIQTGDIVIPASGGPAQIAAAPSPPGMPVLTANGGSVIPAG